MKIVTIVHLHKHNKMPCIARITSEKLRLPFGDGEHYFYMENVCNNGCDGDICELCLAKSNTNVQGSRRFDHGVITGDISPKSHIYDSRWYKTKVEAYGEPTKDVLELAMDAQKKARSGRRVALNTTSISKGSTESSDTSINSKQSSVRAKKIKKKVLKQNEALASFISTPATVLEQLEKNVIHAIPEDTVFLESMDDPIQVISVTRVHLQRFKHRSVMYWKDNASLKVYEYMKNGSRGKYIGCWDSKINDILLD
jgi:hypothetical protein